MKLTGRNCQSGGTMRIGGEDGNLATHSGNSDGTGERTDNVAKSNDVIGFGVEDGKTDFYGITLTIAADGTVIPSANTRNLGGGRRMMLWKNVDDSAVVYLVVCIQNEARWLSLRSPQPCETVMQRTALRELIHGLTLSAADVTMMTGENDGKY